ncbi:MAG TPA: histidine phosphatase family protein [Patescibacteria group bacterium]|nr:histidine phosphatase family protein [Patescibacteria group bacterium]
MTFYIFRHGATYFSKNKIFYGDAVETAEILPENTPIIKKLASYLKKVSIDKGFTSPYKRSVQTTDIIKKEIGLEFEIDDRLGEQMMLYGKETFKEFQKRLTDFVNEVKEKNYKNVAICSHGWPIAGLIAAILKGKIQKIDLLKYPETGELIIIKDGKVETIDFNQKD